MHQRDPCRPLGLGLWSGEYRRLPTRAALHLLHTHSIGTVPTPYPLHTWRLSRLTPYILRNLITDTCTTPSELRGAILLSDHSRSDGTRFLEPSTRGSEQLFQLTTCIGTRNKSDALCVFRRSPALPAVRYVDTKYLRCGSFGGYFTEALPSAVQSRVTIIV